MKKVDKIKRDEKTKIINYILEEYDKDYRKKFNKSEFSNNKALTEIINELKELKYIKTNRSTFTISLLGIRYIREIIFNRNQYLDGLKIQWSSIIIAVTLSLISNLIAIYSIDSTVTRVLLSIYELILIVIVFKSVEKIIKM